MLSKEFTHRHTHTQIRLKKCQTNKNWKKNISFFVDLTIKSFGLCCMQYCDKVDYPMYACPKCEAKKTLPVRHLPLFYSIFANVRVVVFLWTKKNTQIVKESHEKCKEWIKLEHFILSSVCAHVCVCSMQTLASCTNFQAL